MRRVDIRLTVGNSEKEALSGKIPELSVVFPAYNEECGIKESVREACDALNQICDAWELIVVDDGSSDRTGEILKSLKKEFPNLTPITYTPNRGYAHALRTGFQACRFPYVFYSDADAQFDLKEITLLYRERDGADMVVGYRPDRQDPPERKIYSKIYHMIQRLLLGIRARDINCAFKLFTREFLDSIPLTSEYFLVDAELFVRAGRIGATVIQVPVTHRRRENGSSTVTFQTFLQTWKGMFQLRKEIQHWKPFN